MSNASTVQQVEDSMTESKPAPEFVMHQVPVFDTHKDHRVPGITAQNIREGSSANRMPLIPRGNL